MHPSAVCGAAPAYQGYSYRSVSISAAGRGLIALGPAAACLALAGGMVSTAPGTQAWIYALAFAALAIVASATARSGRQIPIPWFCAALLAWPLAQLAPLGAIAARIEPQRSADFQMLSGLGVSPAAAISLYPYATAHSFLVLAGSVALFLLAREAGRAPGALAWLAAGILLLGLAEILPALRQWAQLQTGAAAVATPGADFMHGTFGNRNLLCAWLEGCYGVALSLTLACPARQSGGGRPGMGWPSPGRPAMRAIDLLAIVTAAGCVVVVAGSASRMGILMLVGETALLAIWLLRRNRRTLLIAGVLLAIVTGVVINTGANGVVARFSPASLQLERQGRLAMWADSIRAVRLRPLLGAGLGCFPFAFQRSQPYFTGYTIDHPHNEYLEAMVECGIPFTLLLGRWAAAGLWRRGRSAQRAAEGHKEIALGCLAGVLAILAHGAVDFPLRIPAILGLVSVLLGAAFAHARLGRHALSEDLPGCGSVTGTGRSGWKRGWPAATAALGMAGLSLWSVPPADGAPRRLERWNAEAYYRAARADFGQSRLPEALDGYWQAVRANPYAARVWSELALAAEAQGDRRLALRLSALALDLEPHASWSQWAVGNLRLRLGDMDGALALLEPLVSQMPEMRRPVWDACWKAGIPGDQILARLTGKFPDDLEDYLRYLLDRGNWKAEVEACYLAESLGRPRPAERALREIFERLFRADQSSEERRLWKLYAPAGSGRRAVNSYQ